MKRIIEELFIKWKESSSRKPLLIYGARQIGKTYSMLAFGKENYENTVYCNFEASPELHYIFKQNLNPTRIINSLSAMLGVQINKGTTLIIFDEIQACEEALASLKYFNEEANEYHIMAASSLLGLAINRGHYSFPVGKVDMMTMYPLSFKEFLMATNNDQLIKIIEESYENFQPCLFHNQALELYRTYLVVGGYPAAINEFLSSKDFNAVRSVQSTISDSYIADMAKYSTPIDMVRSIEVYNTIFSQLAKENSKFQFSVINSKARASKYESSIAWLKAANVILKNMRINEGNYPVSMYEDLNAFKIYYSDIGLLTLRMSINPISIIQNINISDQTRGMLAESYVAEELVNLGFSLHYWTSGNSAEVDFVIQQEMSSIPLEVKSSNNVKSKSLQLYLKKYNPKYAIRVSTKNFGYENGIKSIPLYAVFCLKTDD